MQDDTRWIVEQIERSGDRAPYCEVCGAYTVTVYRDGAIWLDCSTRRADPSLMRRLATVGHTRTRIVSVPAAA